MQAFIITKMQVSHARHQLYCARISEMFENERSDTELELCYKAQNVVRVLTTICITAGMTSQ